MGSAILLDEPHAGTGRTGAMQGSACNERRERRAHGKRA